MAAGAPPISVVITTHNEEAGIGRTLSGLKAQIGLTAPLEVVLVDDRSSDATLEVAGAVGLPGLRIIHNKPDPSSALTTRQQALDLGFAHARGAVVLILDGDSHVPPDWAMRMSSPILAGEAEAVAGRIGFRPARGAVALWQNCDASYYYLVSALVARMGGAGGVFFGNFAFRRALYAEVGGFAAIGHALTEDLSFALALQRRGHKVAFPLDGPVIEVAPCADFNELVTRTTRIGRGEPSALGAVLALWPLTLVGLILAALVIGGGWWGALGLRYLVGVALVRASLPKGAAPAIRRFAWAYEPMVFALAAGVLMRLARRRKVTWGGRDYGG